MFKFPFFVSLLSTTVLLAAPASSHEDLKACGDINDDTARLACFDQHILDTTNKDENHSVGKWRLTTETSRLDDSQNVFLQLTSEDSIRGRFSGAGPMVLHIMCRENTTDFSIYFNGLHMSDYQYGTVTYRLDKTPARKKKMVESTSHQHLGLWGGRSSIPFLKAMLGHSEMLVEATPYGENSVIASFDISGFDEAILPVRDSCHW
ncbi:hypothetical protein FAP39_11995 [Shimia litoralis]|uniref:Type VI secretion system-associated protein TagO n=1 Tax=Shimia litoralis TaxID=420403 RepID=A0A4U7N114_9RHOB|nr:hypothetical protein FAP39_11995 [Shimia litoralis]